MRKIISKYDDHKVVVVTLKDKYGRHMGKSICLEGDQYDPEVGVAIATIKAKIRQNKTKKTLVRENIRTLKKLLNSLVKEEEFYNSRIVQLQDELKKY